MKAQTVIEMIDGRKILSSGSYEAIGNMFNSKLQGNAKFIRTQPEGECDVINIAHVLLVRPIRPEETKEVEQIVEKEEEKEKKEPTVKDKLKAKGLTDVDLDQLDD